MIVLTIIGGLFVFFFISGVIIDYSGKGKVRANQDKWIKIAKEKDELAIAVHNYFIPDFIDYEKFIRNSRSYVVYHKYGNYGAWEDLNRKINNPEPPLNPTFSFSKLDLLKHKAETIPYWFFIAYPDVAIWFGEKQKDPFYVFQIAEKYKGKIKDNPYFTESILLRDLINEFRNEKGALELAVPTS